MNTPQPQEPVQPVDVARYKRAVELGRDILQQTNSKAQASREIYKLLMDESREVVLQALIDGATVTPKGAPTYFYNIKKKLRRQQRGKMD